jgi:hypothetical protein
MTPTAFLRTVFFLWGDHWQKPCLELLARHGFRYSRQQLRNWKNGDRRVPEYIEEILMDEKKARRSAN